MRRVSQRPCGFYWIRGQANGGQPAGAWRIGELWRTLFGDEEDGEIVEGSWNLLGTDVVLRGDEPPGFEIGARLLPPGSGGGAAVTAADGFRPLDTIDVANHLGSRSEPVFSIDVANHRIVFAPAFSDSCRRIGVDPQDIRGFDIESIPLYSAGRWYNGVDLEPWNRTQTTIGVTIALILRDGRRSEGFPWYSKEPWAWAEGVTPDESRDGPPH